jgi:hypothetical protein
MQRTGEVPSVLRNIILKLGVFDLVAHVAFDQKPLTRRARQQR